VGGGGDRESPRQEMYHGGRGSRDSGVGKGQEGMTGGVKGREDATVGVEGLSATATVGVEELRALGDLAMQQHR
jgi:hypothetical protein